MSDTVSNNPDTSTSEQKHGLRPSDLSGLYPKAKTYDQQLADQRTRELRRAARQPRHVSFVVTIRLFSLVFLVALFISLIPIILFANVLAGAFFIVLLAIILIGIGKWQAGEVSSVLYKKGLDDTGFLTLYLLILAPAMVAVLCQINTRATIAYVIMLYAGMFALHFAVIYGLLQYMIKRQQ